MPGLPHLAHSSLAELLLQTVAPQLPGSLYLSAQLVDHSRPDVGHGDDEEIREYRARRRSCSRFTLNLCCAEPYRDSNHDRHGADRSESREQRTSGRGRHDDREQDDPYGDPGESEEALVGDQISRGRRTRQRRWRSC